MPSLRMPALLAVLAIPAPLAAQDTLAEDGRTTRMMEKSDAYFHIRRAFTSCRGATAQADIVVCGHRRPDPRYEPPPPPMSADMKTVSLGAPPLGGGVGAGVLVRGCFLQKCPRPLYFIDVAALPEAPPGSDAERIARGEMPAR